MAVRAVVNADHKVFVLPYHSAISKIIRPLGEFNSPEGHMMVMPHNYSATRLARNMGFRVDAPIMSQYDWRGTIPFKSQRLTAAMLTMNRRGYVLSEMGTGKTRAALFAIDYMIRAKQAHRCLIVAPLSTLSVVWGLELMLNFPHLSVKVLHGSRERRVALLAQDADIYLVNHDGVQSIKNELVATPGIDMVLLDELGKYRNGSTDRWEAVEEVIQGRAYVWGMTGSPTPKEPADAWSQAMLVTPEKVKVSWSRFRKKTMYKFSQFRWIAKDDSKDTVYELLQPAIRFARKDVVELPPLTHSLREVPLSADQAVAYKKLMAFARISYQDGEVTAANAGVLYNKLMQVSCGWVYTTTKDVIDLNPKARLDAVKDIIDEAAAKVIVYVSYTHSAQYVWECLDKEYPGQVAFVTGDVSPPARNIVFADFQSPGGKRILVAHPECMAHGLNLQIANVIVWFSLPSDLDTFEQACARIPRPGQQHNMLIVYLVATPIERKTYKRLQDRASLQGALLEMFESERDTL